MLLLVWVLVLTIDSVSVVPVLCALCVSVGLFEGVLGCVGCSWWGKCFYAVYEASVSLRSL